MTQDVLNAFMAGRQFRNDAQDREMALQERQNAQGLANTQGKITNALMGGDRAGAQRMAQGSGSADVMGQFQSQVAQMDDSQRAASQSNLRASAGLAMQLLQVPEPQRQAWLQQRAPVLQDMGVDPASLGQFGLDDASVRQFIGTVRALDEDVFGEMMTPQTLGANDTRVDPLTGQQTVGQAGIELRGIAQQNADTAQQRVNTPRGPLVNVNTAQPQQDPFRAAVEGVETDGLTSIMEAGDGASRNLIRLQRLETLIGNSPQGLRGGFVSIASDFGLNVEGASEVQAAEALISAMVPEQRQPGSGPMSDADLDLFKRALPRILNQPGGNRIIIDTIRQINLYDQAAADIVRNAPNAAAAREQLNQMQNPLAGFGGERGQPSIEDLLNQYGD